MICDFSRKKVSNICEKLRAPIYFHYIVALLGITIDKEKLIFEAHTGNLCIQKHHTI